MRTGLLLAAMAYGWVAVLGWMMRGGFSWHGLTLPGRVAALIVMGGGGGVLGGGGGVLGGGGDLCGHLERDLRRELL